MGMEAWPIALECLGLPFFGHFFGGQIISSKNTLNDIRRTETAVKWRVEAFVLLNRSSIKLMQLPFFFFWAVSRRRGHGLTPLPPPTLRMKPDFNMKVSFGQNQVGRGPRIGHTWMVGIQCFLHADVSALRFLQFQGEEAVSPMIINFLQ